MHLSPIVISTVVALFPFTALAAPISSSDASHLGINKRDVASDGATLLGAVGKLTGGTAGDVNAITGNTGNIANTLAGIATGSAVTIAKNGGNNVEGSVSKRGLLDGFVGFEANPFPK